MAKQIVASGHPLVSKVALEIMEKGGNAYDAAVAGGFLSSVAEPALTSLGGGGFLLAAPSGKESVVYDFFVDVPGREFSDQSTLSFEENFESATVKFSNQDQVFHVGMASAGVPGCLKGYMEIHRELGCLSLEEVLAPTIHWAREGVPLSEAQAYALNLLDPILSLTEEAAQIYCTTRVPSWAEGDLFRNIELSAFLERLLNGLGDFYSGEMADFIHAQSCEKGGFLRGKDLSSYQVLKRSPLCFSYQDFQIEINPLPSLGGPLIRHTLEYVEKRKSSLSSPDDLVHLVQAFLASEKHREQFEGPGFSRGTTHLSVLDREGNIASMTTSNGEGCGHMIPGTGVMLNNMLGEEDLFDARHAEQFVGRRLNSMMAPALVRKNGNPYWVLGSGGSKRIRSALVQVLIRLINEGQTLESAIEASRIHWEDGAVQIEPGVSSDWISALQSEWTCNEWSEKSMYFGGVHAIDVQAQTGMGDPRRGGAVATGDGSKKTKTKE